MPGISFAALSEHGLAPTNNDAYCAERIGKFVVCALADGLPAHPHGGAASTAAIEALRETIRNTPGPARDVLIAAVRKADAAVGALAKTTPRHAGLATTLVACLIDDRNVCTALAVPEGNAMIVTGTTAEPAAVAARTRRPPGYRPAPAAGPEAPSLSGMVSHVLGAPYRLKDADLVEFVLGDEYLLLGSDGLTGLLGSGVITGLIRDAGPDLGVACEKLVQEAMRAGAEHTITVVLARGPGK